MNTTAAPEILDRVGALGDETRTRILCVLDRSELTVGELGRALHLPQPTVSRHLKTLAAEGWVEARAEGRSRHYRVATDLDEAARAVWSIIRDQVEDGGIFAADAERARAVLDERIVRSSAFFAESAAAWDDVRTELFGSAAGLAPLLGLLNGDWTVADLGVGTGVLADQLAPFVTKVIGIDRSPEMLRAAEARLASFDNVELRQGELESLPLGDSSVDVVWMALVLHYVPDPARALAEARRILRPGGRLILVDMRPHQRGTEYAEQMGHVWAGFDEERLNEWFTAAGFDTVRFTPLRPDSSASGPLLFLATASA